VTRAELLLALSDERDLWLRRVLGAWRDGYRAGFAAGAEVGYGRAVTDWKVTAGGMTRLGGRTFAELYRRRYPPGGRASWLIIRGRRYRPGGRQSPIIPRDGAA
jgi:hypothetical protein